MSIIRVVFQLGDHHRFDHTTHRLGDLHERFEPVLAQLVKGLPRLARYGRALEHALEQAEAGQIEWVSEVRIESYHTVWFELHEDLLRVLGRVREE